MELRVIIIWFVKKVQIFKIQYIYNKIKVIQKYHYIMNKKYRSSTLDGYVYEDSFKPKVLKIK